MIISVLHICIVILVLTPILILVTTSTIITIITIFTIFIIITIITIVIIIILGEPQKRSEPLRNAQAGSEMLAGAQTRLRKLKIIQNLRAIQKR